MAALLSDNIRNLRKEKNMSQDELAEKLGVSRQSVSLWENGQTQPTIENVVALTKIFNVSFDDIFGDAEGARSFQEKNQPVFPASPVEENNNKEKKNGKVWIIALAILAAALLIATAIIAIKLLDKDKNGKQSGDGENTTAEAEIRSNDETDGVPAFETSAESENSAPSDTENVPETEKEPETTPETVPETEKTPETSAQTTPVYVPQTEDPNIATAAPDDPPAVVVDDPPKPLDLFNYCKNFAIKIGTVNGDHTFYQQPSAKYGGNANEYFSIAYWGDSDRVEFSLHCPLDETMSINFYLIMRGGYNGTYEYCSSKYYRSSGTPIRNATGYIDPSVFTDNYPLNCTRYYGDTQGQNSFMEESREGMVDLIKLLKNFVQFENMGIPFSAFGFVNF